MLNHNMKKICVKLPVLYNLSHLEQYNKLSELSLNVSLNSL